LTLCANIVALDSGFKLIYSNFLTNLLIISTIVVWWKENVLRWDILNFARNLFERN